MTYGVAGVPFVQISAGYADEVYALDSDGVVWEYVRYRDEGSETLDFKDRHWRPVNMTRGMPDG